MVENGEKLRPGGYMFFFLTETIIWLLNLLQNRFMWADKMINLNALQGWK